MSDATVETLTGAGRAAIHAVLLSGVDSPSILDQAFRGTGLSPHGTVIGAEGEIIDDVIVIEWPGAEPRFLFTLHGSPLIRDRIIERFTELGASRASSCAHLWSQDGAGQRLKIRDEALQALPHAVSKEACAFLLEQSSELGFSGWFERAASKGVHRDELDQLLRWAPIGIGMLQPARIVLAGPPNAGKSTLFNVLYGEERVLTSQQPGTTRDLIEGEVCWCGFPIQLVDGAGLRSAAAEVEQEGVRRMQRAMEEADLVVYLIPPGGSVALPGHHGTAPERTLVIHSRRDEDPEGVVEGLAVSSVTGEGIVALQQQILHQLYGSDRNLSGRACPFLPAHQEMLVHIGSTLDAKGDLGALLRQYGTSEMGGPR